MRAMRGAATRRKVQEAGCRMRDPGRRIEWSDRARLVTTSERRHPRQRVGGASDRLSISGSPRHPESRAHGVVPISIATIATDSPAVKATGGQSAATTARETFGTNDPVGDKPGAEKLVGQDRDPEAASAVDREIHILSACGPGDHVADDGRPFARLLPGRRKRLAFNRADPAAKRLPEPRDRARFRRPGGTARPARADFAPG